jgi:hypothetical protein
VGSNSVRVNPAGSCWAGSRREGAQFVVAEGSFSVFWTFVDFFSGT